MVRSSFRIPTIFLISLVFLMPPLVEAAPKCAKRSRLINKRLDRVTKTEARADKFWAECAKAANPDARVCKKAERFERRVGKIYKVVDKLQKRFKHCEPVFRLHIFDGAGLGDVTYVAVQGINDDRNAAGSIYYVAGPDQAAIWFGYSSEAELIDFDFPAPPAGVNPDFADGPSLFNNRNDAIVATGEDGRAPEVYPHLLELGTNPVTPIANDLYSIPNLYELNVTGLNDRGEVFGYYSAGNELSFFLWKKQRATRVFVPPHESYWIASLNDRGLASGYHRLPPSGTTVPVLFDTRSDPPKITELEGGGEGCRGAYINDRGTAVTWCERNLYRWRPGANQPTLLYELSSDLIPYPLTMVNKQGDVVFGHYTSYPHTYDTALIRAGKVYFVRDHIQSALKERFGDAELESARPSGTNRHGDMLLYITYSVMGERQGRWAVVETN